MPDRTLEYLPVSGQLLIEHTDNGAVRVFIPLTGKVKRRAVLLAVCIFIFIVMVMLAGARGFADAFGRTGLVLWILACMFTLVLDLVFVSLFLIRKPTIIEADANGLRVSQEDSKRVRNWPREKITRISVIPVSVLSNLAVHIGYDWPVRIAFWHDHRELRSVAAALNAALRIESTR